MWKPRVLPVPSRPRLGGGAARFAAEIRARFGPSPDSRLYPEAWLVFREQEEREQEQAAAELHLTQLTLRLALQLHAYFSTVRQEADSPMEVQSLRETLRTCLTALESRDRETCREVRLLLRQTGERGGEEPDSPPQAGAPETIRERLVRRLAVLERQAEPGAGKEPDGPVSPLSRMQRESASRAEGNRPGRMAASPWRQAALPTLGTLAFGQRRAETALKEHKERFLQLLRQAEPGEREEIWRLTEEYTQRTVRQRLRWNEGGLWGGPEKLERLVRESTAEEYTRLIQVLGQQLRASSPPGGELRLGEEASAPNGAASAPQREPAGAAAGDRRLTAKAAPLLDWLEHTLQQGRVRRTAMLAQLQAAPEEAQEAFLALARESGAFHIIQRRKKSPGEEQSTAWAQLTLLTRESRRRELEELIQWTRAIQAKETEPGFQTVRPSASAPAAEPAGRRSGQGEPQRAGTVSGTQNQGSAVGRELRQFLTLDRRGYRRGLLQLVTAAQPGEREALLSGLLAATGGRESIAAGKQEGTAETILRLLERSANPVELLQRVKTAQRAARQGSAPEGYPAFASPAQGAGRAGERRAPKSGNNWSKTDGSLLWADEILHGADLAYRNPLRGEEPLPNGPLPHPQVPSGLTRLARAGEQAAGDPPVNFSGKRPAPATPLIDRVIRWAEDRRRWERLELAKTSAGPAAEQAGRRGTTPVLAPYRQAFAAQPPRAERTERRRQKNTQELVPARQIVSRPEAVPAEKGQRIWPGEREKGKEEPAGGWRELPPLVEQAGRRNGTRRESPALPGAGRIWEPIPPWEQTPRTEMQIRGGMPPRPEVPAKRGMPLRQAAKPQPGTLAFRQTVFQSPIPKREAGEEDPVPRYADSRLSLQRASAPEAERPDPMPGNLTALMAPRPGEAFKAVPRLGKEQGWADGAGAGAPPQLELRREPGRESAAQGERRIVEEQVTLAMERQAPQLHLLRRQSQEQERALEEQKQDLGALKKRLEQQESMVRRAVETARGSGGEEPAQVRRLAKAVMKELEGQLRLERQRRGLS